MATFMATKITHPIHCGNYPNYPLIGTKGCINYNLMVAQRQFGYSIKGSPTHASLATLLIYYDDGCAWKNVIRMERDSKAWAVD